MTGWRQADRGRRLGLGSRPRDRLQLRRGRYFRGVHAQVRPGRQEGRRKILFVATGETEQAKAGAGTMYADAVAMAKKAAGRVAGCGMSWTKAWAKEPKLDFWYTDRAHPSAKGYYINACVIFAALTDCSPVGMAVYSHGLDKTPITKDEAALLQRAAWDQCQEDRKNEK